jgi:hypothetical protein
MRRRCGWLPAALETPPRVVWARKHAATDQCPTSVVTAQSLTWIEQFYVFRRLGPNYPGELSAREVEAFLILDRETRAEGSDGRQ